MRDKILVTDSLFIFESHVKIMEEAGYSVERLDKPDATEEELCTAIRGKVGYVLGGVERVTEKVIDAADRLKVISFTGIGYTNFIPAWRRAMDSGITITYAPDAPTQAVAEYAVGAALLMNRSYLDLGRFGTRAFAVTPGLESQHIGIIGLGRIGSRIAEMVNVFKPAGISYAGRRRHEDEEARLGIERLEIGDLLATSDIVFLCVSDNAGHGFFGASEIGRMKQSGLLVSFMHQGIIDEDALYGALKAGRVRAYSDFPMGDRFDELPIADWYCLKASNTITEAEALLSSDTVVNSMLRVLAGESDEYVVHPSHAD